MRASIQSDAESVDDEPSHPRPTGAPAARISATGAMPPPPIIMFELGQCATPTPGSAEPRDLGLVRVDAVRDPAAVGHPPDRLEVLDRAAAELLRRERVLVGVLGEVRVQPHVEPLGELRGAHASARG